MILSLKKPSSRILFGMVLFGVSAVLGVSAVMKWVAHSYGNSSDPRAIQKAIRMEPGNASHYHRLARLRQANFLGGELEEAIRLYRHAVQLNPASTPYWMDLASAYEQSADQDLARDAFDTAKGNCPISPQVAWAYGNFLLRQGELSPGFAEIRRALLANRRLTRVALSICWRVLPDVDRIWDEVLPPEQGFYLTGLSYFVAEEELDPALSAWERFIGLGEVIELNRSFPLMEALFRQERIGDADRVWKQALRSAGAGEPPNNGDQVIWNGGFEREPVNGGFGWRRRPAGGAAIELDSTSPRSGLRSLRIDFDGTTNINFNHWLQYVPVMPRTRYRFRAFLRTREISTDNGIRFSVYDPGRARAVNLLTPNLTGTHPWTPQEAEFTTGPGTWLLVVVVRRLPSRKFNNKLSGTAWVDDVSLTLASQATPPKPL